jgi:Leucine-rich repeat (LRR) protein
MVGMKATLLIIAVVMGQSDLLADVVESAVRRAAEKPKGALTKADYEKVTRLNLAASIVTRRAFESLAKLSKLSYLQLPQFTRDRDFVDVAKCKQLTSLHLRRTEITDEGLKEVAKLQQLTTLELTNTDITDKGLKQVSKLKKLSTLYLGYLDTISDAGLKEVSKLENLERLILTSPKITDKGLKELFKLKKLKELSLFGTKVTKAGVAELQKAVPKCKISHNAKK